MSSSQAEGHDSSKRKTLLIYLMVSLGLAYHFEDVIEETLAHAFEKIGDMIADEHDLNTISILFWVFRTYGHNMSSGISKLCHVIWHLLLHQHATIFMYIYRCFQEI